MTNTDKKKNKATLLLLLAFIALVATTLFTRYYSSRAAELLGPNSGVEKLSTCGGQLVAISRNRETYVWSWNNLSGRPEVGTVDAQNMTPMIFDRLLWVPAGRSDLIIASNLKGDKEVKRLSLGSGKKSKYLEAGPNGKFAAALLETANLQSSIQLCVIDSNLTSIRPVLTKTLGDKAAVNYIGISNNGKLLAVVGGKNPAWILVVDAEKKQILWEKDLPDSNEMSNIIFSPDDKTVYASDSFRYIYVFESNDGKAIKRLQIDKYKARPNNPQTILCLAISPNGRLLAASTEPASAAWVWDIKSGNKITVISGGYTISGIAFSPDSSLLATGILVSSKINVWKIPEKP